MQGVVCENRLTKGVTHELKTENYCENLILTILTFHKQSRHTMNGKELGLGLTIYIIFYLFIVSTDVNPVCPTWLLRQLK